MITWKRVKQIYKGIISEAGHPRIKLITPKQWNKENPGFEADKTYGFSHVEKRYITINYKYKGDLLELKDTIWHEILHILFTYKKHWWIYCAAEKLSGNKERTYESLGYIHDANDVPDKDKLLRLVRKASSRLNKRLKYYRDVLMYGEKL